MIVHDSWWANGSESFNYHGLSSTIIDYHAPFDQGLTFYCVVFDYSGLKSMLAACPYARKGVGELQQKLKIYAQVTSISV